MENKSNIGKISAYVAIIFTVIGGMVGMYEWGRNNARQLETQVVVTKTDTLYVALKIPDVIEKPVYIDRIIHRVDTVYRVTERERIVEVVERDTVWYAANPKWLVGGNNGDYSELPPILRADREIPEIVVPMRTVEKREWWQDLLYVAGTAAATYGVTRIK